MAFGQGTTGLIVASIISLSSGVAFIICFREFVRELFASAVAPGFGKTLRRNRNILLDEEQGRSFVVADDIFDQLLSNRKAEITASSREWQDRSSYLMTIGFLGFIALAGFLAGLSHFA